MNAIALEIDGLPCNLPADFELEYNIGADIFNFERTEGSYTHSISLPFTSANHRALRYAYRPDAVTGVFRDYPAKLFWKGKLFRQGFFFLESVELAAYKGVFRSDAGIAGQFSDMPLNELLADVPPFNINPLQPTMFGEFYYFFNGYEQDIQLPTIVKDDSIINSPWSDKPIFAAAIKISVILQAIADKMGLTYVGSFDSASTDINNLAVVNLERIDSLLSDHKKQRVVSFMQNLPELTLSEFINSLKILGVFVDFDLVGAKLHLDYFRRVLRFGDVTDWTVKAVPTSDKRPSDFDDIDLSFAAGFKPEISDDFILLDKVVDLPAKLEADIDKIYLVREVNAFYQLVDVNEQLSSSGRSLPVVLEYIFIGYADNDFVSGSGNAKNVKSEFSPLQVLDIYQTNIKVDIRDNGNGFDRLRITLESFREDGYFGSVAASTQRINRGRSSGNVARASRYRTQLAEDSEKKYNDFTRLFYFYPLKRFYSGYADTRVNVYRQTDGELLGRQYEVTAVSADLNSFWVDTNKIFTGNADAVEVFFSIPITPIAEYTAGRCGVGYLQDDPESVRYLGQNILYNTFKPVPIDNDGIYTGLGSDLRFNSEGSLLENVWQPLREWAATSFEREQSFRLTFADLYAFSRRNRVRVENSLFLVKEIRAKLRMDGSIPPAVVRLRKV